MIVSNNFYSRRKFLKKLGFAAVMSAQLSSLKFALAAGKQISQTNPIEKFIKTYSGVRTTARIGVVGAGIAGLTSAYLLRLLGFQVCIYEEASFVGGRASTDRSGEIIAERGAQFFSDIYTVIPALLTHLNLDSEKSWISTVAGVVRDQKVSVFNKRYPWTSITSGYLNISDSLDLAWNLMKAGLTASNKKIGDYAVFEKLDDRNILSEFNLDKNESLIKYFVEPTLAGLFFQEPEETSMALWSWIMSCAARNQKLFTLKRGLGGFTESLASHMDIRLNTSVDLIKQQGSVVRVAGTSNGNIFEDEYDVVIVSVPAEQAKKLTRNQLLLEEIHPLLETQYSSTTNLALRLSRGWRSPFNGAYGFLVPRSERQKIVAVTFESQKDVSRLVDNCEQIQILTLKDDHSYTPQEIEELLVSELEIYLPGIRSEIVSRKIFHQSKAIPMCPVGKAKQLARYQARAFGVGPVVFAGDYLGTPCTEGAAESGLWAASSIAKYLSTS